MVEGVRREGEGERVGLLITLVFWVGVLMFIYRIYSDLVLLKAVFCRFLRRRGDFCVCLMVYGRFCRVVFRG